jgi:hypothetical protein
MSELHSSQTRLALFRPVAFEGTFASFNAIAGQRSELGLTGGPNYPFARRATYCSASNLAARSMTR